MQSEEEAQRAGRPGGGWGGWGRAAKAVTGIFPSSPLQEEIALDVFIITIF